MIAEEPQTMTIRLMGAIVTVQFKVLAI